MRFLRLFLRFLLDERGEVQLRSVGAPGVKVNTVSITAPTALAANAEGTVVVTLPDLVKSGDYIGLMVPNVLEAGLVKVSQIISADGQITVRFRNTLDVAGPATAARVYTYVWVRQS